MLPTITTTTNDIKYTQNITYTHIQTHMQIHDISNTDMCSYTNIAIKTDLIDII